MVKVIVRLQTEDNELDTERFKFFKSNVVLSCIIEKGVDYMRYIANEVYE